MCQASKIQKSIVSSHRTHTHSCECKHFMYISCGQQDTRENTMKPATSERKREKKIIHAFITAEFTHSQKINKYTYT